MPWLLLTREEVSQGERGDVSPFGDEFPIAARITGGSHLPPLAEVKSNYGFTANTFTLAA